MAIEWTKDLATSVDEIDEQHKEIFKRIADLSSACRAGRGRSEIEGMIKFLADYVSEHFSIEEKYMRQHQYPDYNYHKSQHITFIRTVADLKNQLKNEGPSLPLVIKTNYEIADWLRDHIRKIDKALGNFLTNRT